MIASIDRFLNKVCIDSGAGCWLWTGGIARSNGYGRFWNGTDTVSAPDAPLAAPLAVRRD